MNYYYKLSMVTFRIAALSRHVKLDILSHYIILYIILYCVLECILTSRPVPLAAPYYNSFLKTIFISIFTWLFIFFELRRWKE